MLYNIKIVYDDGNTKEGIISHKQGPYTYNPKKDKIKSVMSSIFKYEVEHPVLPPTLFTDNNKKFIIPHWLEVHPDTTYDDIIWIRPKLKKEIKETKGSLGTYKTVYNPNKKTYTCTCMGFFRARSKGGVCKHIKALQETNKN